MIRAVLALCLLSIFSYGQTPSLTPSLTVTSKPKKGTLPLTVEFFVACPTCVVYAWDFGDGTSVSSIANPTHVYLETGVYFPVVAAADSQGHGVNASLSITVTSGEIAHCPTTSIWSQLTPVTEYYALPSWVTNPGPAALTWIQPANLQYGPIKNSPPVPDTSVWLPAVNTWSGATRLYCEYLLVEGGTPPYSYSGQNLPPGLHVNSITGLYGGFATTTGTYQNILFCATDANNTRVCLSPRSQQICDKGKTPCTGFGQ